MHDNTEAYERYDRHKNTIDEATKALIRLFSEPDPHPTDEDHSYLAQADAMLRGLLAEASVDGSPDDISALSRLIRTLTYYMEEQE